MARPKYPPITRRVVLEAALKIIDDEGLDFLSIRELGRALDINGTSLYYHFSSKEEILVGAAQLALEHAGDPAEPGQSWRDWLRAASHRYREVFVEHPGIVPIVLRGRELGVGIPIRERHVAWLVEAGVPPSRVAPLLDALESIAIGSALQESGGRGPWRADPSTGEPHVLTRVTAEADLSEDDIFELMVGATMDAIVCAPRPSRPRPSRPRKAPATKPPAKKAR